MTSKTFFSDIFSSSKKLKTNINNSSSWFDDLNVLPNNNQLSAEQKRVNFIFLTVSLFIIFSGLLYKSFLLQIKDGRNNFFLSNDNRAYKIRKVAIRGSIIDAYGQNLAVDTPSFQILFSLKNKKAISENDLKMLQEIGLSEKQKTNLEKAIENKSETFILKSNLSKDDALDLITKYNNPELILSSAVTRSYPMGPNAAHMLGFLTEIDQSKLDKLSMYDYFPGKLVGSGGLEEYYERVLNGEDGEIIIETNAKGEFKNQLSNKSGEKGESLKLNIISRVQRVADESLAEISQETNASGGAVIMQDVKTGGIIAYTSYPRYDPNIFYDYKKSDELASLLTSTSQPFFDRASSGEYSPASTYKLVTALATLESGVITADGKIEEVQTIHVGNSSFSNWTLLWGVAPHGLVDLRQALGFSSDIYFYEVSGGYNSQKGFGIEKLASVGRRFGFDYPTGVDLPFEGNGVVPDPEFKRRIKEEDWYTGDTYISAIGQGDTLATVLQVNNMVNTVANGGELLKPRFVYSTIDANGSETVFNKEVVRRVGSREHMQIIAEGMRHAVTTGTSKELDNFKVPIAAKTGTAETGNKEDIHGWFVAFMPYENPQVSITVFLEKGGQGSKGPLQIAKRVLEEYLNSAPDSTK